MLDRFRPQFEEDYACYSAADAGGFNETLPKVSPSIPVAPAVAGQTTPPFEATNAEGLLMVPYEKEFTNRATSKARLFHFRGYDVWIPKSAIEGVHPLHLILKKWFKTPTWKKAY